MSNNNISYDDDFFLSLYNKIDSRMKLIFVSTLVWGLLAHGMGLFNKYSMGDDISNLFGIGNTYIIGRWFLHILGIIVTKFFHSPHFSLPLTHGLLIFVYISLSAYLIVRLLDINRPVVCVVISGIMVTSPSIASLFGYLFTAPYYAFAILLATVGAFILCKYQNVVGFILGVFSITCSVGIYQAYFPLSLSLIVLYLLNFVDLNSPSWKIFIKKSIFFLSACLVAMVLYFLCTDLSLKYFNAELLDYRGISTAGKEGIRVYLSRFFLSYKYFFSPKTGYSDMFPMSLRIIYYVMLLSTLVIWIYSLNKLVMSKKCCQAIQKCLLMIIWPIAVNFIFVMCSIKNIDSLMVYSHVFNFILIAYLIDKISLSVYKHSQIVYISGFSILLIAILIYIRYDNAYFLKLDFSNQRAISYATTLITQIKSLDGYSDEYSLAIIGKGFHSDKTIKETGRFNAILQRPISNLNYGIRWYGFLAIMRHWCAFNPKLANSADFENLPEVKAMPTYPKAGSIKIINDTVVVKFND